MGFNKKPEKPKEDISNSAVRRALLEEEAGLANGRGVAGMSELQENRRYQSSKNLSKEIVSPMLLWAFLVALGQQTSSRKKIEEWPLLFFPKAQ